MAYKIPIYEQSPIYAKRLPQIRQSIKITVLQVLYIGRLAGESEIQPTLFQTTCKWQYHFCICLVDLLCTKIKDVLYDVNLPWREFEEHISRLKQESPENIVEISHHLAHNIIHGALEYAEENGIAPHEDFKWASLIIGPDNDDIPLIDDIPFGENGVPYLEVDHLDPKLPYYLSQLRKTLGEGNFRVVIGDMDAEEGDDDDYETEDDFDPLAEMEAEISSWDENEWQEYLTSNLDAADFSLDSFLELNQVMQVIYKKHIWPKIAKSLLLDKISCAKEIDLSDQPIDTGYNYNHPDEVNDEIYEIFQLISDTKADKNLVRKRISQLDRLISSYPNDPVFYNLKYNCLKRMGKMSASSCSACNDHFILLAISAFF